MSTIWALLRLLLGWLTGKARRDAEAREKALADARDAEIRDRERVRDEQEAARKRLEEEGRRLEDDPNEIWRRKP